MKFDRKGYFQIPLYLSKIPSITCQANKAFLGSFFCTGQQLLWRGKWNFRIDISRLFSLSFFKPKMVRPKQFPKFSILIFFYFSRDQRAQQDHPPSRLRQQALLQRWRGLRLQGRPYSTRIGYNAGMLSYFWILKYLECVFNTIYLILLSFEYVHTIKARTKALLLLILKTRP